MCRQCLSELTAALRGLENGTASASLGTVDNQGVGTKSGRWLFVPLAKWDTMPADFYSLRKSQIYLQLVFRIPDVDVKFCMRHDLLPPDRLRRRDLESWISGARAALRAI